MTDRRHYTRFPTTFIGNAGCPGCSWVTLKPLLSLLPLIAACLLWFPVYAGDAVVTPATGPIYGGTPVTITGSGFVSDPVASVDIDSNPAANLVVVNDTTLTVTTPVGFGAGPTDVYINFQSGNNDYTASAFTYEDVSITSVTPSSGPLGGGTTVTILGNHFAAPTTVTFGLGQAATVNIIDSQTLSVVTPPAQSGTPGPVDVALEVSAAQASAALSNGFTYVQPTVTGITPANGPIYGGTPLTISGSGFSSVTTAIVKIGGAFATSVTIVSDSVITAITPEGSASGIADVDILYDSEFSGTTNLSGAFTYENISLTSITPSQGPVGGGTQLLVKGTLFKSPMNLTIDGTIATDVQILDENTLLATTPTGFRVAAVDVTLDITDTNTFATLTGAFTYTSSSVGSVSPTSGSTQGGTYVQISGSGVPNNATVLFGGVPATNVTVVDKDTLSAISPPNSAGTVTISVDDGFGPYNLLNAFTYIAPPPGIDGIAPSSGLAAGGSSVTISGNNFQAGLSAAIGGQNLTSLTVVNSSTVSGTVPTLPLGTADIVVTNPDGQSATFSAGFNVVTQIPQIFSVAGDVAPYGAPDGLLNAGDLLVLQQFVSGLKFPTVEETLIADVAPLNSPDGVLNAGDSVVLTRAVLNQITLNPVVTSSGTPAVDNVTPVSGQNPYTITGTASPNTIVEIYVNAVLQQQVTSDANGTFTANVILADGQNNIYASADDGTGSIIPTNQVQVTYNNSINRTQSGIITVDTAWTVGSPPQPYRITSDLVITAGTRLTLQPGVVLEFDNNAGLIINGELQASGLPDQPVIFTSSNQTTPVKGIWSGTQFGATAANSFIDNATIEWAVNGVTATTASNLVITNSSINNYSNSGVSFNGGSTGSITNNVINNFDKTGSGILVDQSSPLIADNTVLNNFYGIDISAASPLVQNNVVQENVIGIHIRDNNANPAVSGNILAANTSYGVQITGTGQDLTNPQPVLNGNNLYGNSTAGLYVTGYGSSSGIVLDFTDNWWGDAVPVIGNQIIVNTGDTPATVADFTSPQAAISAGPVLTGLTVTEQFISPNISSGIKDSSAISASISESANWTVSINSNTGTVRSYNGTGTSIVANWGGRDNSAVLVADGKYSVTISATSSGSGLTAVGNHNFTITVDNTAPVADIDFTLQNANYQSVLNVPVTGSATDTNQSNYLVEYGSGSVPATWTVIASVQNTVVSSGVLADWTIVDANGVQVIPNGLYSIRLTANDAAGNSSTDTVIIGIANALLYNVSVVGTTTFRPAFGEMASVSFSVLLPSTTVKYTISDERTGQVIRTLEQVYGTSINNSLSWDGKDDAGNYVPDEAYVYTLTASNGTELQDYTSISYQGTNNGVIGNPFVNFDPVRNQFWKNTITVVGLSRVTLCFSRALVQISCLFPTDSFKALDGVPLESGTQWIYWDGYDLAGDPLIANTYAYYFEIPIPLPSNTILVKRTTPFVSGVNAAPNIEVKSNPYIVTHSYDEQTQIRFLLDQDSIVSVKLLPPGISDPNDPSAQVLINAVTLLAESAPSVPQIHTATWKGYDDSVPVPDTNNILVETEGTYTFTIEATSVVTSLTSLYRGAVTLYH